MNPAMTLRKKQDGLSPERLTLLLLLCLAPACGRVGDPEARIHFSDASVQKVSNANNGCQVVGGRLQSYTTSDGTLPVSNYATETFSGTLNNVSIAPELTLATGASTMSLAVSPGVKNLLIGSGYLIQTSTSSLDCEFAGSPADGYHRLVFPMLGFSAARTFTRNEDVMLTMTLGATSPLSTTVPSGIPTGPLVQPSVPLGMRVLKIGRSSTPAVTDSPVYSTTHLGYVVVTDAETGVRALALSYRDNQLPSNVFLKVKCGNLWNLLCFTSSGPLRTLMADASGDRYFPEHYLGPLLPGRGYTLQWEEIDPEGATCIKKARIQVPYGREDVAVEVSSSELEECDGSDPVNSLPDGKLFSN
jgi:hypothetical protein